MLNKLREANIARHKEWPNSDSIDFAFRVIEVLGEAGELAEAAKKFLRRERNIKGSSASLTDITAEMADVIIAVDLLANDLDIDLERAVRDKFNKTSEKYGFETRIKP